MILAPSLVVVYLYLYINISLSLYPLQSLGKNHYHLLSSASSLLTSKRASDRVAWGGTDFDLQAQGTWLERVGAMLCVVCYVS